MTARTFHGLADLVASLTRTHAVEGNGWIKHVCHGCPEPEAEVIA